jgi:branched-chain amino acid transport system permease protein
LWKSQTGEAVVKVIQLLITGITMGSIYSLVALGYVTIYRTSRIVNMAQGSFVMLGALICYSFVKTLGFPYWLSGLIAVSLVAVLSVAMYWIVLRRLVTISLVSVILATIGLSILFENLALLRWGGYGLALPPFVDHKPLSIGGVYVPAQSLWVVGLMLVIVSALWFFTARTRTGKKMSATASDPEAAAVCGVPTNTMILLAFGIGAVVGAMGGIAISNITPTTYLSGGVFALSGFVAAILGGWGSAVGAVVGGITLGIIQSLATGWLPVGYQDAIAFVILIAVLYVRPQGLLGTPAIEGEAR